MNRSEPFTLFLAPSGSGVGLTTVTLGLVRALDSLGVRVAFFKPIGQLFGHDQGPERSTHFIRLSRGGFASGWEPRPNRSARGGRGLPRASTS